MREIPPAFRGRYFTAKPTSSQRGFFKRDGKPCKQPACGGFGEQWSVSSRWHVLAFFLKCIDEKQRAGREIRALTCSSAARRATDYWRFLSALFFSSFFSFCFPSCSNQPLLCIAWIQNIGVFIPCIWVFIWLKATSWFWLRVRAWRRKRHWEQWLASMKRCCARADWQRERTKEPKKGAANITHRWSAVWNKHDWTSSYPTQCSSSC